MAAFSVVVGLAEAQDNYSFPTAAINPISTYSSFDEAGYGNVTTDQDGVVKAVFCYDGKISLNAVQSDGGEVYASYDWYLLDKNGNESESAIHSGNGNAGQQIDYNHQRSGYHRFRVYGFNKEDRLGCFEMTDIAIYVFPEIKIAAYQTEKLELCQNEAGALQRYAKGEVILDASSLSIEDSDTYNGDRLQRNYEWFVQNGAEQAVLQSGVASSYILGSDVLDLNYGSNALTPGTYQYGVRVSYLFDGEAICTSMEIMMHQLSITAAPSKPIIKIGGAIKARP
jgi:hypothetical protein